MQTQVRSHSSTKKGNSNFSEVIDSLSIVTEGYSKIKSFREVNKFRTEKGNEF